MTKKKSNQWLILGSGPSAMDWWGKRPKGCIIATCNAGIDVVPYPDFYAACEAAAIVMYKKQYTEAKEHGTVTLTIDRTAGYEQMDFDEVLPVSSPEEFDVASWELGKYRHGLTTGSILVQYAANHGAKKIHLLGFEGYPTSDGPQHLIKTAYYQGPLFERMAEAAPDIEFIFYGRPRYPVSPLAKVKDD